MLVRVYTDGYRIRDYYRHVSTGVVRGGSVQRTTRSVSIAIQWSPLGCAFNSDVQLPKSLAKSTLLQIGFTENPHSRQKYQTWQHILIACSCDKHTVYTKNI